jgi:hypothetical protein
VEIASMMKSNNDIEDVLSSIRRLVAEGDARPVSGQETKREALILDQARRVIDPEDPFQMIQSVGSEADTFDFALRSTAAGAIRTAPPDAGDAREASVQMPTAEGISRGSMDGDEHVVLHLARDQTVPGSAGAKKPVASPDEAELADLPGDDEALRQLIEDVVREELAGALGERITRNVRKLVRREIRRLMSDEAFD